MQPSMRLLARQPCPRPAVPYAGRVVRNGQAGLKRPSIGRALVFSDYYDPNFRSFQQRGNQSDTIRKSMDGLCVTF